MILKSLPTISIADIAALVIDGTRESRTLDFKRDLDIAKEKDRREFLADVSALANTAGGDLVFGVDAPEGVAIASEGIDAANPDATILLIEDLLRSGVEPRLPKVAIRWIPMPTPGRGSLVVRVGRSGIGPHRVVLGGHDKFYRRNSAGKYQLDVGELRAAFLAAESIPERIRQFRRERVGLLQSGEAPVLLQPGAKLVFHLVPQATFVAPRQLHLDDRKPGLPPLAASGWDSHFCLDGQVTYVGGGRDPDPSRAYTLTFRNGGIEVVAVVGSDLAEKDPWVYPFEADILSFVERAERFFNEHDVEPPYILFLSFAGVFGHQLYVGDRFRRRGPPPVRQDVLLIPEIEVVDLSNAPEALRPLFDIAWSSFGYARSFSYDPGGTYVGLR